MVIIEDLGVPQGRWQYYNALGNTMANSWLLGAKRSNPYVQHFRADTKRRKYALKKAGGRNTAPSGYRGSFKKPKRAKNTKHQVSLSTEFGGALSQTEVIYLGHGTAPKASLLIVSYAIIKKLFNKFGHEIKSMQSRWRGDNAHVWGTSDEPLWLVETYRDNVNSEVKSQTIDLVDATYLTYADIAEKLTTDIISLASGAQEQFILSTVELRHGEDVATTKYKTPSAIIRCDNAIIDLSMFSQMTMQNQSVGTAATDDQVTDVTNNPLEGKLFEQRGRPGFQVSPWIQEGNNIGTNNTMWPDKWTGLIGVDFDAGGGFNYSAEMKNMLRRPPSANVFQGSVKQAYVTLNPGGLKKSSFSYVKTMLLNTFFRRIAPWIQNIGGGIGRLPYNFGNAQMFALEKMCKTGQQSIQAIVAGYEVQQTYRCSIRFKRTSTVTDQIDGDPFA